MEEGKKWCKEDIVRQEEMKGDIRDKEEQEEVLGQKGSTGGWKVYP